MSEPIPPQPLASAAGSLELYLLDRLGEVRLHELYYEWLLELSGRQAQYLDHGDGYSLTGEDLRAAWEAQGFEVSGRGKTVTASITENGIRVSSTRLGLRKSDQLELTINLEIGTEHAGSALQALAADVRQHRGLPLMSPPYPRPNAHRADDVTSYVAQVAAFIRTLVSAIAEVPPLI